MSAHLIDSLPGYIELGNLNELGVCSIEFDVSAWKTLYPTGVYSITYIRPTETTVYPVAAGDLSVATVGLITTLTWTVSDAVTAIAGSGSVVVQCAVGATIVKRSDKVHTIVSDGHAAAGTPPSPLDDYIEKWGAVDVAVTESVPGTAATATVAQDATGTHFAFDLPTDLTADASATTLDTGEPATASITQDGTGAHFAFGLPRGLQGIQGEKIASAAFDGNDILLTMTDASEVRITGGKTAIVGATGNGIASVTLTAGNHAPGTTDTYTITYTDATTATFTVYNGQDYLQDMPMTWAEFRNHVRQGTITNYFSVGDQFNVLKGATNLVFDIVDIGSSARNTTANGNAPSDAAYFTNFPNAKPVTMLMHDCIDGAVFDAPEANYKITTQINSGAACNITLESNTIASATYDFTAPQNLVVGGKLRLNTAVQMQYYATPSSAAVNITIAAGSTNGSIASSLSVQNHKQRVSYGSNKYTESAIRQWLNAAGAATSFWVSKSDYDLAPSWNATWAGFLNGLDADFQAVVGETTRQVELNTITDGGGDAVITDKYFLPSRKEIFNDAENVTYDGVQFQYYAGSVDADRIKYDVAALSTARTWWTRSPNAGDAYYARTASTSGAITKYLAYNGLGAAAACVIL